MIVKGIAPMKNAMKKDPRSILGALLSSSALTMVGRMVIKKKKKKKNAIVGKLLGFDDEWNDCSFILCVCALWNVLYGIVGRVGTTLPYSLLFVLELSGVARYR
jgi:hypothetical protein